MSLTLHPQQKLCSIYLADDDIDDREFFTDAIREIDPRVILTQAKDGADLMNKLSCDTTPKPELLFLDINMPGKSGFDCLEEIRKNEGELQRLNVIMFSTSGDPANIEKAKVLGADFYAVKPGCFNTLKSFLSQVLQMDWQNCQNLNKKFRLL